MATLKDVAQEAGLSVTTVSRILNNRGYISSEARQKVSDAMQRLNYQPNEVARSLSLRRSNMVALIVPHIRHPYFAALVSELEEAIRRRGYQILLFNTKQSDDMLEKYLDICQQNRVSGVILCSADVSEKMLKRLNAPIITVERYSEKAASSIVCDNYKGGQLAAERLIEGGCRNLVCISGSSGRKMPGDLRRIAFQDVCKKYKVRNRQVILPESAMQAINYTQCLESLFSGYRKDHPESFYDGMFASGDAIAAEAVRLAQKHGIDVPKDLQIIGFDDTQIADMTYPGITTIHQPIREMAQKAAEMLAEAINGRSTTNTVMLPVYLVERESTR